MTDTPPQDAAAAPLFYVVDAKGEDLAIAWTDEDGRFYKHPLSPFQAACLIEDLGKGVRKRVPGGW
ncbi:MAG: hypothetical protein M0006_02400 [Magnetospirillum sp.]|nr:hypothetical protein [Magnetospirillum sp.]